MQRIFYFCIATLFSLLLALTSCETPEAPQDPQTPEGPEEPNVPEVLNPSVELIINSTTETSISFTLIPQNATSVRYAVYGQDETLPTVEELMTPGGDKAGRPADAVVEDTYTVTDLQVATVYTVVAAAMNADGYSELSSEIVSTVVPEPSVELDFVRSTPNEVIFTIAPANASVVSFVVLESEEEIPSAADIIENGYEAELEFAEYTITELEPETEYVIVAAAMDLVGDEVVVSEHLEVTTTPEELIAPSVGDFYYSDGSWSKEYNPAKTPIGIVFFTGEAKDFSDRAAYYTRKDGSAMEEIKGYVVALKDATPAGSDGVWWSFFSATAEATGVSVEVDDFLGYTNTLAIKAQAEKLGVGFSDSHDSYPAAYVASVGYEEVCPSPQRSSGWYLPAAGQLQYIWDQAYFNPTGNLIGWVEGSIEALGDLAAPMYAVDSEYWSSTEQVDSFATSVRAYYVCFDSSMFQPGFTNWYNKNNDIRVRSILTF